MSVFVYFLTPRYTELPVSIVNRLEEYYGSNGSWQGVESVFISDPGFRWPGTLLLDGDHRVLVDRRSNSASIVGSHYEVQPDDVVVNLTVQGKEVGYLVVLDSYSPPPSLGPVRAILLPLGFISIFLLVFLVIVATLLVRRLVNPLADVIYAARQVANGNLETRIPMKGPQDLRSLSESFNEMASSLERSDRERRVMLADIAHELRTPLSVIRGRLEGIVDGIYSENGSQVSMALEQTYLLERLVDDLRLLTLVETRQLPFDKAIVDVGPLIERIMELFSAEAQERNISLSFPEREGNLSISVDPQRFEQVISNLIGNSLRYVPENGRVWVIAHEATDGVRITVNDNGPGIPEEDLPFIFDRFWRKEKSRSRTTGGTGLGLAIARQLVEAQSGRIEARNLPEGGLQVVVELKK